jgi:hypothetical protein
MQLGTYKVRNEIETKRNKINENETKRKNFSYIVGVSFIGGGKRRAQRKTRICHKSLTNFITLYRLGEIRTHNGIGDR